MDEKKWHEADAQIPQVSHVIVAAGIDAAAADLERELAAERSTPG